jgi:hypothetical protein
VAYAGVEIPNLAAIQAKAAAEPLLGGALRSLLEDVGEDTEERAIDRAPVGVGPGTHGSITAAISHQMDPRPLPMFVTVDVAPITNDGFRYPWALDAAQSWFHRARTGKRARQRGRFTESSVSVSAQGGYHYRAANRKRKATRRWFRGSLDYRRVQSALEKGARAIEAKWGS